MDTERKLRAAPRPGPLRPETYPSLVSDPRASDGGKKGGRKEERNGTAGSVSEPYISAGTNCPIIHSVRQLRCSPLIHRCYFPPSSPFLLLPFLLSPLPFSSLLSSSSLSLPSEAMVRASRGTFGFCRCLSSRPTRFCFSPSNSFIFRIGLFFSGSKYPMDLIGEGREREISNFHN